MKVKTGLPTKIYWVGFKTIVRREVHRFLRLWTQTILPSAITMTLYFIVFGNLIGNRIGQMNGFDYVSFITPGLVMMSVITNAYTNVVSSFFLSKFQRSIEELLVSPVPNNIIILGYITGGILRGLIVGTVVLLISLFFTHIHVHHAAAMVFVIFLSATLFSLGGMINAIFANKFDDIAIIPTFLLTPLTYLGGVFYSVQMLPSFWQTVSKFNPMLYMINAFRYGMLGYTDVPIIFSISMMCLFIVVFYITAHMLLRKGVGIKS